MNYSPPPTRMKQDYRLRVQMLKKCPATLGCLRGNLQSWDPSYPLNVLKSNLLIKSDLGADLKKVTMRLEGGTHLDPQYRWGPLLWFCWTQSKKTKAMHAARQVQRKRSLVTPRETPERERTVSTPTFSSSSVYSLLNSLNPLTSLCVTMILWIILLIFWILGSVGDIISGCWVFQTKDTVYAKAIHLLMFLSTWELAITKSTVTGVSRCNSDPMLSESVPFSIFFSVIFLGRQYTASHLSCLPVVFIF